MLEPVEPRNVEPAEMDGRPFGPGSEVVDHDGASRPQRSRWRYRLVAFTLSGTTAIQHQHVKRAVVEQHPPVPAVDLDVR